MKMLIGGEWVSKEELIEVKNPYDGALIDTVPHGDKSDVDKAISSAIGGFKVMRELASRERAKILRKTAESIEGESEEIAKMLSRESGKPLKSARGEVSRAVQTFALSSEEAKRIHGETIPFDSAPGSENRMGYYVRVPLGVVAAITPFNFPLNLVAHKLGPAFAAGNAVVLKPASAAPLTALKLGEIMVNSGLPKKALNIVTGRGEEIGKALVTDPRIRKISFTGSAEVGKGICKKAGLTKLTMELGSNSAVIIAEDSLDALDINSIAKRVVFNAFAYAGQVCISVQRVIIQEVLLDQFLAEFLKETKKLVVGDPLDEGTDVGPMITERAAIRAERWIREAVNGGAKILIGGKRERNLVEPTILTNVSRNMKVWCKEVFAPVFAVMPYNSFSEAIALVNGSAYGLQAGIYTKDIKKALKASKEIEVGGIIINDVPTYRVDLMPYGGTKGSGIGREGPKYAVEEMTELRTVVLNM
jgi:glyceraldehyde-3-phosphate dehydrogenase (NADP+)